MMPPLLVAGHLRQLPHTPAPAAEVIDVEAAQKAVPMFLPAPVYNSLTGDVYELPSETARPVDSFPVRPVFGGKGRAKPCLCTRLACTSKRPTRRRRPAENLQGVPYLLNSIYLDISRQTSHERKILKRKEPIQIHFNFPQRVPLANTGFALYTSSCPVYVPKRKCAPVPCWRNIPPVLPVYGIKVCRYRYRYRSSYRYRTLG